MAAAVWKTYAGGRKFNYFNEATEKRSKQPFYFIQGADAQLGLTANYPERKPYNNDWSKEIILAEQSVECINALHPRPSFFVMCGDLCDAFPDEDPSVRAQQEADFKRIYSKIDPDIPFVYHASFGDEYFSFWVSGTLFIVINSQYFFDASLIPEIASEQERWLDTVLAEGKALEARIVMFQHIPWFTSNVDEPGEYFNIPPEVRKVVLEKLQAAGVTHVFSGHLHRNALGRYESVELVTSSAIGLQLGSDDHGLRIVKVTPDSLQHSYHPLSSFPKTVQI